MEVRSLGIGIVWWPALDPLCRPSEGLIDVVEAEPEAFWMPMADGVGFRSFLRDALAHLPQPKLLHGVGAPLGGTCLSPDGHAAAIARDVAQIRPEFVSEHLSFTRFRTRRGAQPIVAGFMMPPLQSPSGVAVAAANISRHRVALGGVPLAVETAVSYLPPAPGEWPDGDFVAAVADAADCGILLDLHNVLCNARNGRQSVADFCDTLPLGRVWELHLAGGENEAGFYLDAHAGLVEEELLEVAATLMPRLPNLRAVIFEIMPEAIEKVGLAAIGEQLARMKDLWNGCAVSVGPDRTAVDVAPITQTSLNPEAWEELLGRAITGLPQSPLDEATAAWWRCCAPALDLYRLLAGEGRASAIASAAPHTTRLLLRQRGGTGTRQILAEFWRQATPGYTATEEARAFLRYLADTYPSWDGLSNATASDMEQLAGPHSQAENFGGGSV
ncbi:MAG: DUF692 domain-containing protein [Methylocella sp.]